MTALDTDLNAGPQIHSSVVLQLASSSSAALGLLRPAARLLETTGKPSEAPPPPPAERIYGSREQQARCRHDELDARLVVHCFFSVPFDSSSTRRRHGRRFIVFSQKKNHSRSVFAMCSIPTETRTKGEKAERWTEDSCETPQDPTRCTYDSRSLDSVSRTRTQSCLWGLYANANANADASKACHTPSISPWSGSTSGFYQAQNTNCLSPTFICLDDAPQDRW